MNINLKTSRYVLVLGLFGWWMHAGAADLKIGFVNPVKVLEAAPQVQEANARLEKEFQSRAQKIENAQKEIKRLEEELEEARRQKGLKAFFTTRDAPFQPEPFGPKSTKRE